MRLSILVLIITLFLPIFVQIFFPILDINLYNPYAYSFLFLIFISFFLKFTYIIKNNKNYKIRNRFYLNIIVYNLFVLTMIFLKGLYDQDFLNIYRISLPYLAALLIIYVLYQKGFLRGNSYKILFDKFSLYLGIFVTIQIIISIYESITGNYLISSKQLGLVANRDIFTMFGYSISTLFGFRFLLGGLYFHHNVFGTILVLYNLIFIIRYYEDRKPIFLFFLIVVFIAVLGNTSRFAIFTIVLTNVILFYKIFRKRTKFVLIPLSVFLLYMFSSSLVHSWNLYFSKTNSLNLRFYIWRYLFSSKFNLNNLREFLIGIGIRDYLNFDVGISGKTSLENTYLIPFVLFGIIGFSLFLFVFHIYPLIKARRTFSSNKLFIVLFVLNIFLPALVGGTFFYFPCYILLTVLYLRIGVTQNHLDNSSKFNKNDLVSMEK